MTLPRNPRPYLAGAFAAVAVIVVIAGTFPAEVPSSGTPIMGASTNAGAQQFARVYDLDSDAGQTEYALGVVLRSSARYGSAEVSVATETSLAKMVPAETYYAVTGQDDGGFAYADGGTTASTTCRSIFVGTGGDVSVGWASSGWDTGCVIFKNVPDGTILPLKMGKLCTTGTTASNIVCLP